MVEVHEDGRSGDTTKVSVPEALHSAAHGWINIGRREMDTSVIDQRIVDVMPPSGQAGDVVDWAVIAAAWGHGFPDDYREFVRCYGEGAVEDFLGVLIPGADLVLDGEGMYQESENARLTWQEDARPHRSEVIDGVDGEKLVAWGVDAGADILCWDTSSGDPNAWPVVVFRRQGYPHWLRYEMGMVAFLLSMFSGRLEENPLSGDHLWNRRSVKFLHRLDETALHARGGAILGQGSLIPISACHGDVAWSCEQGCGMCSRVMRRSDSRHF
ncbi:SMI1/KNR4 family protein [Streptomyces avicenniae]|uniref:SMI1/KNR4 family protein n=1 Tax=Streptomyces avicenniae TaxID=500153 RepID=UPI00167E9130|nr:SMI1/KNR4 family protein [Streptomyces avicenniae]